MTYLIAAPGVAQNIRYNVGDPMRFGVGYNTLTGEYAGNCMEPVVKRDIQPAGDGSLDPGQMTRWELTSVDSLATLTDRLDFAASASASFVAGSVSASTSYVRSRSFNNYHQFVYVTAAVANTTQTWTGKLLPEMQTLHDHDAFGFLQRCGDAFIRTITTGGELSAIVDLNTSADQNAANLSIAFNGNYGTVEGRAALKQQLDQIFSNRQVKVTVIRRVSGISCVGHNMRSHDAPQTESVDA